MNAQLISLLAILAAAILVAAGALVAILQRRDVLLRATDTMQVMPTTVLLPDKASDSRIQDYLDRIAASRREDPALRSKLVQAGIESSNAESVFTILRVLSLAAFPIAAWIIVPTSDLVIFGAALGVSLFLAYIVPLAMLDRLVRLRQERVRRSVPDALDLLVVCVESGISLDAAVLRVARDIRFLHPDLAHELAVVNRVTNAGIPRDAALRGLSDRTGVAELRTLVASLVQSEKWGTSIATVLRVASDTLRRKRRQAAEKRAKEAPLKMTLPLILFILPPLFVAIMAPAIIRIAKELGRV